MSWHRPVKVEPEAEPYDIIEENAFDGLEEVEEGVKKEGLVVDQVEMKNEVIPIEDIVEDVKFDDEGNQLNTVKEEGYTSTECGKKFICSFCQKEFTNKSSVKSHIRVHTGEKPFRCETCGKEFSQKGHLTIHARIHSGEKPFKCDDCEKSFSNHSNLVTHRRIHTGEKPFRCEFCGKSFSYQHH